MRCQRLVSIACFLFGLSPLVHAQDAGRRFVTTGSHYAYNTVVAAACDYTPSYQTYQQTYPVQKVVAQDIAVAPLIVTVPVDSKAVPVQAYGNPYYYSVNDAMQQRSLLRDVVREELRSFMQPQQAPQQQFQQPVQQFQQPMQQQAQPQQWQQPMQQAPQPPAQRPTTQQAPPTAAPEAESNTPVADTQTPEDLQKQVIEAFTSKVNCVKCHGGTGAPIGNKLHLVVPDGSGYKLAKLSSDKRWKTYAMSATGAMPPAAVDDASKAMENKYLQPLLQWASAR